MIVTVYTIIIQTPHYLPMNCYLNYHGASVEDIGLDVYKHDYSTFIYRDCNHLPKHSNPDLIH